MYLFRENIIRPHLGLLCQTLKQTRLVRLGLVNLLADCGHLPVGNKRG